MVKIMEKWSGIHTQIQITTKSWRVLEGHPLPIYAKFGWHPFPRSSALLAKVITSADRPRHTPH